MNGTTVEPHVLADGRPGHPVVVLAHGIEDTWTSWQPLADALDPDVRVIALALPWCAGNDYRWRSRRPTAWLREGLDRLDAPPDLLVAHSFGATAALGTAATGDPLVGSALALLCPVFRRPERSVTWQTFDAARASFVRSMGDGVRVALRSRSATLDDETVDAMTELAVDRMGPHSFLTVFSEFIHSADIPLHRVRVPVDVVAAVGDPTLTPAAADALVGGLPTGRLRRADHGHFCHVSHPEAVARIVHDLLSARPASVPTGDPR